MCLTPAPQFPLSASSAVLLWFLSLLKRFTYRPLPAQVSCFILSLTFRMFFRPVDFLCSFCPSVPVLSQASILGCYRKQGSELQRSSPSLAREVASLIPRSLELIWVIWSPADTDQLFAWWVLCRTAELTLLSLGGSCCLWGLEICSRLNTLLLPSSGWAEAHDWKD